MGMIANVLAARKTFSDKSPLYRYLSAQATKFDPPDPDAGATENSGAVNAVHDLAISTQTSGNMTLKFTLRDGQTFTTGNIAYNAVGNINAVHTIYKDQTDYTGGTFALTFNLKGGQTFTTAAIAFNANAATIETAIDVAATAAAVPNWTNSDISVSGGILQAAGANVVLTFDGNSVKLMNHDLTEFDGSLLTGGTEPATRVAKTNAVSAAQAIDTAATSAAITGWTNGDIAVTGNGVNQTGGLTFTFSGASVAGEEHPITVLTNVGGAGGAWGAITRTRLGHTARYVWGLLKAWGVISGTAPESTAAASVTSVTIGPGLKRIPQWVIRELAQEAAAQDVNWNQYYSIAEAMGWEDRAPLAEMASGRDIL